MSPLAIQSCQRYIECYKFYSLSGGSDGSMSTQSCALDWEARPLYPISDPNMT